MLPRGGRICHVLQHQLVLLISGPQFGNWKFPSSQSFSLQVRVFLWGALSDLLPTMFNLMLKRAAVDSRCILCGSPGESVVHALFAYEHAYKVWDLSPFSRYVCLVVFLLCGKYGTMYVQSFHQMNFISLFCLWAGFGVEK